MENVSMDMLYSEIKAVRKKLDALEDMLMPEENLTKEELTKLDKLLKEATEEYKKGQAVKVSEL